MTEIRRSAHRTKGMPIPGVVRRWVVNEAKALMPGRDEWKPPHLDRTTRRLFAELLVEASQRPEFAQWAENCQTASLKTDDQLNGWICMAYTYEKRAALGQPIGCDHKAGGQCIKKSERIYSLRSDGSRYKVWFKGCVTAEGIHPPHLKIGKTERERLGIMRTFPTLELAISYRDRVEKAISDPCNRTAKEKAAAAFSVSLYEPAKSKPTE